MPAAPQPSRYRLVRLRWLLPLLIIPAFLFGCDHGLAPPEVPPFGAIRGVITYTGHPDAWPPQNQVRDLRFVAMRFVPQDTADFLQLNRMAISNPLAYGVPQDTFLIEQVEAGLFLYSGVAQQFAPDILSWRPVGLVEEADGVFEVHPGTTTEVSVKVDFNHPPPFPPTPPGPRR